MSILNEDFPKLDGDDISVLAKLICKDLGFNKPAIERIGRQAGGSARRAVTRFHDIAEWAALNDRSEITGEALAEMAEAAHA